MNVRVENSRTASDVTTKLRSKTYNLGDEYEAADANLPFESPDGGDFHTAFRMKDGTVALIMGDVVGHGAKAAGRAGILCRQIGECLNEGLPPSEALGFVNAAAEMNTEFEGFATVFAGTVAPNTGVLTYASGGHEPALVAEPGEQGSAGKPGRAQSIESLETTGPPLGVLGADEIHYEERSVVIDNGGTLLLYTDGISEARRGREMLGPVRLRRFFAQKLKLRPLGIVRKLMGLACAFTGQGQKLRDDAALIALRRRRWPRAGGHSEVVRG